MGTSKSKVGRTDRNQGSDGNAYKTAKMVASRYFSGNVNSFDKTMNLTIKATGLEYFASSRTHKKSAALASLILFVVSSAGIGLRKQASSQKLNIDADKATPKEILIDYVNSLYPNAVTDEDICTREELLHSSEDLALLFDEDGFLKTTLDIENHIETNIIIKDLAGEIFNDYLSISPMAIENDNSEITKKKIEQAKININIKLKKYKNAFSFNIHDKESIVLYRENLKSAVIAEYYTEASENE